MYRGVLDKLKKDEKKMVSAADNDATEQIINVWRFMIMPWAISVNINWQKKKKGKKFFSLISFKTAQDFFSQV